MVIQSIYLVDVLATQGVTFINSKSTKISGVLYNQNQYNKLVEITVWLTAFKMNLKRGLTKLLQVDFVMRVRSWKIGYIFLEDMMAYNALTISTTMFCQNRRIQNFLNQRCLVIWNLGSTTKITLISLLSLSLTINKYTRTNWSWADALTLQPCSKRHHYMKRWIKQELNWSSRKSGTRCYSKSSLTYIPMNAR